LESVTPAPASLRGRDRNGCNDGSVGALDPWSPASGCLQSVRRRWPRSAGVTDPMSNMKTPCA